MRDWHHDRDHQWHNNHWNWENGYRNYDNHENYYKYDKYDHENYYKYRSYDKHSSSDYETKVPHVAIAAKPKAKARPDNPAGSKSKGSKVIKKDLKDGMGDKKQGGACTSSVKGLSNKHTAENSSEAKAYWTPEPVVFHPPK